MPSINLDLNYFDNIKTMRLVARLGPGSDVLPIKVWVHAGKQSPESGRLALLESELEHICGWWGVKGAMLTAMIETGFLKRDGDLLEINDWFEHSGHLAAFKKRAKKAAKKRWGVRSKSSNASSNARDTPKQCPSRAVHNQPTKPTVPIGTHKFVKPTASQVTEYAKSIGFILDGQKFFDYYESKGWLVGKSPMKNWQACVRTWKSNGYGSGSGEDKYIKIPSPLPPKPLSAQEKELTDDERKEVLNLLSKAKVKVIDRA